MLPHRQTGDDPFDTSSSYIPLLIHLLTGITPSPPVAQANNITVKGLKGAQIRTSDESPAIDWEAMTFNLRFPYLNETHRSVDFFIRFHPPSVTLDGCSLELHGRLPADIMKRGGSG